MSSRRKNTPAATPAASDPLDFLEKLSPAQLDQLEEEVLARAAERERQDLARKAYGITENPDPVERTAEEEERLTNKVLEKFELRGRVTKLEEKLAKKPHERAETRSPIPSLKELRSWKSITKREAANYLRCVPRTIRNYVKAKKLTLTPQKRIATDDKFARMLRNVHGDAVLP